MGVRVDFQHLPIKESRNMVKQLTVGKWTNDKSQSDHPCQLPFVNCQLLQTPSLAILTLHKLIRFVKVGDLHIFGIPQ
jgi:hypothetical protein